MPRFSHIFLRNSQQHANGALELINKNIEVSTYNQVSRATTEKVGLTYGKKIKQLFPPPPFFSREI